MTNKEVYAALGEGCDLATIYRSMHMLEGMGMVKRYDFGDGIARFELVAEGEDDHHHHLICRECSKIVEIDECFPSEFEAQIAAASGYREVSHKLEFFGVCPTCRDLYSGGSLSLFFVRIGVFEAFQSGRLFVENRVWSFG